METAPQTPQNEQEISYGVGAFLWEIVKVFVLALVIIVPVRVFLFQPFFVQGASMQPSYNDGEYLIINEFGYKETNVSLGDFSVFSVPSFKDLQRGDVIVFRYPLNEKQFFIKRVIGLPGERVVVADEQIIVFNEEFPNGIALNEDEYLSGGAITSGYDETELGEDEYYVVGDNRSFSHDSRSWGPISGSDVIGKVLLRAWPLNRLGFMN